MFFKKKARIYFSTVDVAGTSECIYTNVYVSIMYYTDRSRASPALGAVCMYGRIVDYVCAHFMCNHLSCVFVCVHTHAHTPLFLPLSPPSPPHSLCRQHMRASVRRLKPPICRLKAPFCSCNVQRLRGRRRGRRREDERLALKTSSHLIT